MTLTNLRAYNNDFRIGAIINDFGLFNTQISISDHDTPDVFILPQFLTLTRITVGTKSSRTDAYLSNGSQFRSMTEMVEFFTTP